MSNVVPFEHAGEGHPIDFDLYVDLLVLHCGYSRRDAEVEARKECRRDDLKMTRSGGAGICDLCKGAKFIGGMRYFATGTLTDIRPCLKCLKVANKPKR